MTWHRLAAVGDVPWIDRVADAIGDPDVLDLPSTDLAALRAFDPDVAIVALAGSHAELESVVRPLRRSGADVLMVDLPGAAARSVAMQHGTLLVHAADDAADTASDVVRCLAAASSVRVAA